MTELFGKAIYEKLLLLYGASHNPVFIQKYAVGNEISNGAINEINSIIIELRNGKLSNKADEIERIRAVCSKGGIVKIKPIVSDIYLQSRDNSSNIIFITTHSIDFPSILSMKKKLLRSIAAFLLSNPNDKINSCYAVPNNPFAPSGYKKWILTKMIDNNNEFLYGKELWDFIGVDGTYEELLFHFEKLRVGYRKKMVRFFEKNSYYMY